MMVAQRERVLVFSKILDDRAERERNAEGGGEEALEEMVRNSLELERRMAAGESIDDLEEGEEEEEEEEEGQGQGQGQEQEKRERSSSSTEKSIDPLIGGDDPSDEEGGRGYYRIEPTMSRKRARRLQRSVRRRKRVVDEEDASYLSYSETGSSTSGESYVSSSSSCYSDEVIRGLLK